MASTLCTVLCGDHYIACYMYTLYRHHATHTAAYFNNKQKDTIYSYIKGLIQYKQNNRIQLTL